MAIIPKCIKMQSRVPKATLNGYKNATTKVSKISVTIPKYDILLLMPWLRSESLRVFQMNMLKYLEITTPKKNADWAYFAASVV